MDREIRLGEILKNSRLKRKYTQEDIGEKLGVSRQSISNWENGKTYPDIVSMIKLSDIYKISLDTLLKGDDNVIKHFQEEKGIVEDNKKIIIGVILLFVLMSIMIFLEAFNFMTDKILFTMFTLAMLLGLYLYWEIIDKI